MNDFFTWELLATYSGASAATGILVEFARITAARSAAPAAELSHAAAVLLAAQLFTGTLSPGGAVLSLFNAVLVSLAAGGGYELCRSALSRS
ncbi:MAG: hypothetical protein V8Q30_05525 [Acutalibacteraceae bacterium]